MESSQTLECRICLGGCVLPVMLTCFPCSIPRPNTGPGCHSLLRVCMRCARRYLQLDRAPHHREARKRCLLCRSRVDLPSLASDGSDVYIKDYLLMSLDPGISHPCPYAPCTFRGSQMEIDAHLRSDCGHRPTLCDGCGAHVPLCERDLHIRTACPGYTACEICEASILRTAWMAHRSQAHGQAPCAQCGLPITVDPHKNNIQEDIDTVMMRHWQTECPFRPVQCRYCGETLWACHLESHYAAKAETLRASMGILRAEADQIRQSIAEHATLLDLLTRSE